MVNKINPNIKKYNKYIVYLVVSVLFALCMMLIAYVGDDSYVVENMGRTPLDWVMENVKWYFEWSSRLFVNIVSAGLINMGRGIFSLYMGISMFVLLISLDKLFFSSSNYMERIVLSSIVMMFPFSVIHTAGWIAASASYFGPLAFGMAALLPIREAIDGRPIPKWKKILYGLCLLYGANIEQMMVVILGAYLIAVVWNGIQHKGHNELVVYLLLAVLSAVFIFLCPGNAVRGQAEIHYFPQFTMFDVIDKADIGLSTMLQWMFKKDNFLVDCVCLILMALVWMRYEDGLYRAVSLIPFVYCTLRSVLSIFFPWVDMLVVNVHLCGTFTVEQTTLAGVLQWMLWLMVCFIIAVEVFLLSDSWMDFIICIALICLGAASRAAIGFSPTVYASNTRINAVLAICIIAATIALVRNNFTYLIERKHGMRRVFMVSLALLGIEFANLLYLTIAVGRYISYF